MARVTGQVVLLIGTRKGAFTLTSDLRRTRWKLRGPFLKGAEVNDLILDTRGTPTLFAAATSYWFGTTVQRSTDGGETWRPSEGGVRFDPAGDRKVERVWCLAAPGNEEPGVLYAGVDPAALFRSVDGSITWSELAGLSSHPTRPRWNPGAGGLMVHSIAVHPKERRTIYVGISAAGTFVTHDGGATWEPRNSGVLADFLPEPYPDVGQCVHHLELHPQQSDVLWQQNHCGVFRSADRGATWTDVSEGLPSRFGFPIVVHPRDPKTAWVIPEQGPEFRSVVDGAFRVYETTRSGRSWKPLTRGLPQRNAYLHVLRQAFCPDACEPLGLYIGTSNGMVYASRNAGRSWSKLAEHLPEVLSLNVAVTDGK